MRPNERTRDDASTHGQHLTVLKITEFADVTLCADSNSLMLTPYGGHLLFTQVFQHAVTISAIFVITTPKSRYTRCDTSIKERAARRLLAIVPVYAQYCTIH